MILIKPRIVEIDPIDRETTLRKIESAARNCYQSNMASTTEGSAKFVAGLVKSGHMAPVELGGMFNVKIQTSRSVLAELTRHRIGVSYAVESQRYVNESKNQYGVTFIIPTNISASEPDITEGYYEIAMVPIGGQSGQIQGIGMQIATASINDDGKLGLVRQVKCKDTTGAFLQALASAEQSYAMLLQMGYAPQDAREVLPNATACTITMGANLREWKHIFNLRVFGTTGKPYAPCKEIMSLVYQKFHEALPEIFPNETPSENGENSEKVAHKTEPSKKSSILYGV